MIFHDWRLLAKKPFIWKVYELAAESLGENGYKFYAHNLNADESRTIYYSNSISDLYDSVMRESWVIKPGHIIPNSYLYKKYIIRDIDISYGWFCDYVEDGAAGGFSDKGDGTWSWSMYAKDVNAYCAGADTGTVVKSFDKNAYPVNGWSGKYWYILQS